MPEIDMVIDAEVADKAITWPSVIRLIDKSIRDAVVEFMVLPNMDDYEMPIMRQPTVAAEADDDLGSQSQQAVDFATIETDDDFVEVLTLPEAPTQPATEATGLRQRSPVVLSESR